MADREGLDRSQKIDEIVGEVQTPTDRDTVEAVMRAKGLEVPEGFHEMVPERIESSEELQNALQGYGTGDEEYAPLDDDSDLM